MFWSIEIIVGPIAVEGNQIMAFTNTRRHVTGVLYAVAMVALIIGLDVTFFKNRFWERLMANIGTVVLCVAVYFRFLNRP